MRGHSISISKIKENNPFAQRSRSKKEYPFLPDRDVDLVYATPSSRSKQSIDDHQEQPVDNVKKNEPFVGKGKPNGSSRTLLRQDSHWLLKGEKSDGEERKGAAATLRRNFSATSFRQKSKGSGNSSSSCTLERQSSSRSNIQGAMKRAFSVNLRRSSSVNSQSEYCRIIDDQDQPFRGDDCGDIDHYDYDGDYLYSNDHQDHDDCESSMSNGSMEKKCMSAKTKKSKERQEESSKSKSKVVRACKRLLSLKFA